MPSHQGHIARKRFGQNFLTDRAVISDIITAIAPAAGDHMVEIGPGLGALTGPLSQVLNELHVVELDRDLAARLRVSALAEKLVIHEADALDFDFASLPEPLRIVGNLPYNISTPLLFHLAGFASRVRDMHFMLQKEVVERMVSEPGCAAYGRLSVMLQYRFEMEKILDVPPESFEPAPKVESAIVRMIPRQPGALGVKNEAMLSRIVLAAFGQRRKTLRNTLSNYLDAAAFQTLEIDSGLRAEALPLEDFIKIENYLNSK